MSLARGLTYAFNILNPYAVPTNVVRQIFTQVLPASTLNPTLLRTTVLSADGNWIVGLSTAATAGLISSNNLNTSQDFGLVYLFPRSNLQQQVVLTPRNVFDQFPNRNVLGLPLFDSVSVNYDASVIAVSLFSATVQPTVLVWVNIRDQPDTPLVVTVPNTAQNPFTLFNQNAGIAFSSINVVRISQDASTIALGTGGFTPEANLIVNQGALWVWRLTKVKHDVDKSCKNTGKSVEDLENNNQIAILYRNNDDETAKDANSSSTSALTQFAAGVNTNLFNLGGVCTNVSSPPLVFTSPTNTITNLLTVPNSGLSSMTTSMTSSMGSSMTSTTTSTPLTRQFQRRLSFTNMDVETVQYLPLNTTAFVPADIVANPNFRSLATFIGISADGRLIAVGARNLIATQTLVVFAFDTESQQFFGPLPTIYPGLTTSGGGFGSQLVVSGDGQTIIVGDIFLGFGNLNSVTGAPGGILIFHVESFSSWFVQQNYVSQAITIEVFGILLEESSFLATNGLALTFDGTTLAFTSFDEVFVYTRDPAVNRFTLFNRLKSPTNTALEPIPGFVLPGTIAIACGLDNLGSSVFLADLALNPPTPFLNTVVLSIFPLYTTKNIFGARLATLNLPPNPPGINVSNPGDFPSVKTRKKRSGSKKYKNHHST